MEYRPMYYDRQGRPITTMNEMIAKQGSEGKRVRETTIPGYWISTVWLGLDHRYGDGPPLIFETMVFPHDGSGVTDWGELLCRRYSTEADAIAGHEQTVAEFSAKPPAASADDEVWSYVVICREDLLGRRKGPHTLATRRVFATYDEAKKYANTINESREPLLVKGRWSQLRFEDEP